MNEKERKEKLGRNPFEQRKPTRRHKSYPEPERAPDEHAVPEAQISHPEAVPVTRTTAGDDRVGVPNPLPGDPQQFSNVPATATLAWLCVDLWSSTFFEPMFFWMNSPKIVRETIKAASGREA